MGDNNNKYSSIWRILATTLISSLLAVNIFVLTNLTSAVKGIDTKLFTHLTNHELHTPRGELTLKKEFDMHCTFSDRNFNEIIAKIERLRNDIIFHFKTPEPK